MKVLLLALFVAGMAVAVLVKALGGSTQPSPKFRQNDGLDEDPHIDGKENTAQPLDERRSDQR